MRPDDPPPELGELPPVRRMRTVLEHKAGRGWFWWYLDDETNEVITTVDLDPQPPPPRK